MSVYKVSLKSRLEGELEYQTIVVSNRYYIMRLHSLVKKNCNGSTNVVVDDIIGNLVESLYGIILMRGDDYTSFSKYLEALIHKYQVLSEAHFNIAILELRDTYLLELDNRG